MDLNDIIDAKKRIEPYIYKTPMIRVPQLDEYLNCRVYLKAENLQLTNSFKIRGALNKMLKSKEKLKNGVVATSSGSHGIAVAYSAKMLNIPAIIILRDTSPEYKRKIVKDLGADVIPMPYHLRYAKAREIEETLNYTYIHPYENEDIIAGHGTLGIDILENMHFDKIVIPMGGGGLAAGLSTAVKSISPKTQILGCEPSVISKFSKSLKFGEPMESEYAKSIADALLPLKPGETPFPYIKNNLSNMFAVDEPNIIEGEKLLINKGKLIAEISSAIVFGAALQFPEYFNKNDDVCFVISGGNTDINYIQSQICKG